MSKYTAPIKQEGDEYEPFFVDANNEILSNEDIARDLTAYYELLAKQAECGATGHVETCTGHGCSYGDCSGDVYEKFCPNCGADLTKGENHG